ncbi:unnamed protein product [Mytilus edulis]|uniref:Uncharacterized protein n=1 Tax=Mytilus edulis TaxID=6550 RepID=A0A8S3S838_MYTED|nr:unnamed protein product [Mytilus edulis]
MFKQISSKDTCRNNSYDLGISLDSDISDVTCQKDSSSTDFHLFEEIPYSNELEREHGNDDFESSPCSIKTSTPFKSGHRDVYHFECSPIASMLSISPRITKRKTQSLTKRSLHYESNDLDCSINLDISDVLSIGLNQSSNISNPSLSNIDSNELHEVRGNIPSPSSIPSSSNNYGEPNILLFNKHTRTARILRSLKKMCCDRSCLNSLTAVDVKNMRTKYWSKSPSERRQWLFDKFTEQSRVDKNVKFLTEKGITVCQNGFLGVYDINQSVFYRNRKLFLRGVSSSVPTAFRKRTTKYLTAMNWFEDYIMFHGDRMPNINYIYLPYRTRKFVIFKQYVNELSMGKTLKDLHSTGCGKTHFRMLKSKKEERKYYYRKRDAAKSSPSHYLSLIIDGMDQYQASDHVSFFYKASQQKPWKLAPSGMFLSDSNGNIHLPKEHQKFQNLSLTRFHWEKWNPD